MGELRLRLHFAVYCKMHLRSLQLVARPTYIIDYFRAIANRVSWCELVVSQLLTHLDK